MKSEFMLLPTIVNSIGITCGFQILNDLLCLVMINVQHMS